LIGLRAVAFFEGCKGLLVMLVGFGLLALVHHDAQEAAEAIILQFHLNPAHHYPRIFIEAASHLNDTHLILLGSAAFLYAGVRFVEAYGLWRKRLWAEWFAVISGGAYLPIEVLELMRQATLIKWGIFLGNLLVVGYLLYALWSSRYSRRREPQAAVLPVEETNASSSGR